MKQDKCRIDLRVPAALKRELDRVAGEAGVSTNELCSLLCAVGVGHSEQLARGLELLRTFAPAGEARE
ncbi:MAG: hypothetical protein GY715_12985 [Planctomycetes bacterium]|nr:hypothetical protein [Planctomycetota bacterium]